MISFIVPAHNEEAHLGRSLQAIHGAARALGRQYEVIVVDDASSDATPAIARQNNARVVSVNHRQIAATRNSGARAAQGEHLFFVDADTTIDARALASALRALANGAAGGVAPTRFDAAAPLYAHLLLWWLGLLMRLPGMGGGAFLFCTRQAFLATGGFDEKLFGAEDAAMCWALKRQGPFVVLWRWVVTSGRRMRGVRGLRMLAGLLRMAFLPGMLQRRSRVQEIWYESNRDQDDSTSTSLAVRSLHAFMLLLVIGWILPWGLIPWSLTPREELLGQIRLGFAIFQLPHCVGRLAVRLVSVALPVSTNAMDRTGKAGRPACPLLVVRLGRNARRHLVLDITLPPFRMIAAFTELADSAQLTLPWGLPGYLAFGSWSFAATGCCFKRIWLRLRRAVVINSPSWKRASLPVPKRAVI